MKRGEQLFQERFTRLKTAFELGKPDRIPIILGGPAFLKYANPSATLSDMITRREWADDLALRAYEILEEIDGTPMIGSLISGVGPFWFARMKFPGHDLPDDTLWQIEEVGPMKEEDYDAIITRGWNEVSLQLLSRLGYDPEQAFPDMPYLMSMVQKQIAQGLVPFVGGMVNAPFDTLSAARSLTKFIRDLHRIPDKVLAALDIITNDTIGMLKPQIEREHPMTVFVGNSRSGCDMLSLKNFEKFSWPFTKKVMDAIINAGSKVYLHSDSRWDDNLKYFKCFPKGTCIFDPDSSTDIYKIKEILGDTMCLTGDVSPALLSLGTPDQVYTYATKLVRDLGPSGFIMSSGCAVPPNTPLENIKAMIAAATGK